MKEPTITYDDKYFTDFLDKRIRQQYDTDKQDIRRIVADKKRRDMHNAATAAALAKALPLTSEETELHLVSPPSPAPTTMASLPILVFLTVHVPFSFATHASNTSVAERIQPVHTALHTV